MTPGNGRMTRKTCTNVPLLLGVISAAYPIQSLYAPVAALREDAYGTFRTPDVLRPGQTYSVVSYLPNLSAEELRRDPVSHGGRALKQGGDRSRAASP